MAIQITGLRHYNRPLKIIPFFFCECSSATATQIFTNHLTYITPYGNGI